LTLARRIFIANRALSTVELAWGAWEHVCFRTKAASLLRSKGNQRRDKERLKPFRIQGTTKAAGEDLPRS
jgi:hypothetical protein